MPQPRHAGSPTPQPDEPTATALTTAEPTAPEPTAPEPTAPEPTAPEPTAPEPTAAELTAAELAAAQGAAAAGLRASGVEASSDDCRLSRPVQAQINVPVETLLGLSNEPGYLSGYGWLSAPASRQLLLDAELHRALVHSTTGRLLDLHPDVHRPPPGPRFLAVAGVRMCLHDLQLSDVPVRAESRHDPSTSLTRFAHERDGWDDGPTGNRTPATSSDLDHDTAWPKGPTAAWNLAARGRRTHQLKHYGWTPLRTETATYWTSPAGQIVHVPHHDTPPPGIDPGHGGSGPEAGIRLPDPDELVELDRILTLPPLQPGDDLPPLNAEPPF